LNIEKAPEDIGFDYLLVNTAKPDSSKNYEQALRGGMAERKVPEERHIT